VDHATANRVANVAIHRGDRAIKNNQPSFQYLLCLIDGLGLR
jgi:hypothetical protein